MEEAPEPKLVDLPKAWWAMMRREWRDRTTFGKLLYPLWLVESVYKWLVVGSFMIFVVVAAGFFKALERGPSPSEIIPRTHKREK